MRLTPNSSHAIIACATLALAAGCSYGGIARGPDSVTTGAGPRVQSAARPDVLVLPAYEGPQQAYNDPQMLSKEAEVAISDSQNDVVNIYLQKTPHTMVGQLTGFTEPQGMAVDKSANLYVTNTGGADVLVFAPGASTPFLTLDDSGKLPVGVAVDTDGTVYVSNIRKPDNPVRLNTASQPDSAGTGIVVYRKGATKPFRKLTDAGISSDYFVAIGPNHRVFTDYFDQNGVAQIGYFDSANPKLHSLNIPNLQFPGGIKIDDDNILVIDQNARALLVFKPPHRFPRSFIPFIGASDPVTFDYGGTERTVWVADAVGVAEHYAPSGRLIDSINVGGVPIGVVTLPKQ